MNADEMNWLLQRIEESETAKRLRLHHSYLLVHLTQGISLV